ncbi:MAG: signal peptidase I [Oligoflexia bacterium]|nr:signal peptidase I [Oligoflexia bacterium]
MEKPVDLLTKVKNWIADTGKQLAIAIFIVLFLRTSIVEPYKIPSGSMIPTLFIGDHIFVNKFAYGFKVPLTELFLDNPIYVGQQSVPERGDVIVFRYPKDESINYIKRVVGLPGDIISIREKMLYVNDKRVDLAPLKDSHLEEGYENGDDKRLLSLYKEDLMGISHPVLYDMTNLLNSDYGPIEVPPGKLFCMGDNRDRSSDSRSWGFVPLENVKGKALFVWLNFFFQMENQFQFNFKVNRIGTVIH